MSKNILTNLSSQSVRFPDPPACPPEWEEADQKELADVASIIERKK